MIQLASSQMGDSKAYKHCGPQEILPHSEYRIDQRARLHDTFVQIQFHYNCELSLSCWWLRVIWVYPFPQECPDYHPAVAGAHDQGTT